MKKVNTFLVASIANSIDKLQTVEINLLSELLSDSQNGLKLSEQIQSYYESKYLQIEVQEPSC